MVNSILLEGLLELSAGECCTIIGHNGSPCVANIARSLEMMLADVAKDTISISSH